MELTIKTMTLYSGNRLFHESQDVVYSQAIGQDSSYAASFETLYDPSRQ